MGGVNRTVDQKGECSVCGTEISYRAVAGSGKCQRHAVSAASHKRKGEIRGPRPELSRERHPQWKGDEASLRSKHERAEHWFPIASDQECDRCTELATIRHHIDENPGNNVRSNIEFLCRACHIRHHKPRRGTGAVR